ncbi:hypothetical protein ANO14919_079520 [Xylariales sp. No.14919]|nr:hypothetical protein ANO14919_079520 [Xylariales sp. No.14919]
MKKCVWAYKAQREIARRMSVYRGELAVFHPAFATDSKAACVELEGPPAANPKNIEYTAKDDAAIQEWPRSNIKSTTLVTNIPTHEPTFTRRVSQSS